MDEAIYRRDGHHVIGKDGVPLTEGLIGCDEKTAPFVAVLPTPEGPKIKQFSARSNQPVSVASCIKGAGLSLGTWSQSKLETVLAAVSWASCRARLRRMLQRRSTSNSQSASKN
jgi:hypothetical protein